MCSVEALFRSLAADGQELENLLTLAGKGRLAGAYDVNALARLAGLARARQSDLVRALGTAEQAGIATRQPLGRWAISLPEDDARELAMPLRGARLYREHVHRDNDRVFTVVSMPAAPSQLVDALNRTLEGVDGLESTEVVLGQLAANARSRFTVMTPFVVSADVKMTHLAEVNLTHLGGARWRLFAADAESGASSGNQGVGKTWNGRTGDSEAVGHLAQYGASLSA